MGLNSKQTYGADGSTSLLSFYPEKLTIVSDPAHPLYDERINLPLDEAMVRNIDAFGVLVSIVVARDPESGSVLVVDGRQRVRHALEVNKRREASGRPPILVPASTRKGDSDAELLGVMVSTNELRQADPPLVRAAKMQRLKNLGQDDAAVAVAFGCNVKTVEATLCLLDCSKPVQKAIEGGFIGITDAKCLSRLTPAQQKDKVEQIVKATVGKEGHARAKAKREAIQFGDTKPAKPKMKGRKEIAAQFRHFAGYEGLAAVAYREALAWVLGGTPDEAPPR